MRMSQVYGIQTKAHSFEALVELSAFARRNHSISDLRPILYEPKFKESSTRNSKFKLMNKLSLNKDLSRSCLNKESTNVHKDSD